MTTPANPINSFRVGDWVEVRSAAEILATLDGQARLDGMVFMPEMVEHCGKRFRVYKSAHKTCDTVSTGKGRRVDNAVHLELRCNGEGHGACQADCLIFWKTSWLKKVDGPSPAAIAGPGDSRSPLSPGDASKTTLIHQCRRAAARTENGEHVYSCQCTLLPEASRELAWYEPRQYVADYASGNVGAWQMIKGGLYATFVAVSSIRGLGRILRWCYDRVVPRLGGTAYPRRMGLIPAGTATPTGALNLQPGEWVRVKPYAEILKTLDTNSRNRGLYWDAEMVPFCGGVYKVRSRVTQIIDERTGRMAHMKSPCIILDAVACQAKFSDCRMFCPRSIFPYWREIWLDRVPAPVGQRRTVVIEAV